MRFLSLPCPLSNVVCSNELLMKQGMYVFAFMYLARYLDTQVWYIKAFTPLYSSDFTTLGLQTLLHQSVYIHILL